MEKPLFVVPSNPENKRRVNMCEVKSYEGVERGNKFEITFYWKDGNPAYYDWKYEFDDGRGFSDDLDSKDKVEKEYKKDLQMIDNLFNKENQNH